MRTLRLARVAAEAEGLRLRERARRTAMRAAWGVAAAFFVSGAIAFIHIAAWGWLRRSWDADVSALLIAGVDVLIAVVFGLLASRSSPSRVELEAITVRDRAWQNAKASLGAAALTLQLFRTVGSMVARRR